MTPFTKTLIAGMLASTLSACSSSDDDSSASDPIDDQTDTAGTDTGETTAGGTDTTGTDTGETTAGGTDTTGTDTGETTAGGTDTTGTDTGETTAGGMDTTGTDTGETTAGGMDTTGTDTGETTAGGMDTTGTDTGETTAGGTDATGTDTGETTAGGTDATGTDTGETTAGGTDTAGTDTGGTDTGGTDGEFGTFNRSESERLSVSAGGPSRTDSNRTDEAPSAPTNLTALLVAENWIEIDWAPSTDNSRVVAYEIYRDGNLVRTLDEEPDAANPVNEERDLRTTTYIDCNFTKNPGCDAVGQPGPGSSHDYTVVAIDDNGNRSAPSLPATFSLNTIDPNGSPPDLAAEGYVVTFSDDFDADSFNAEDNWVTDLSFAQFNDDGRAVNGAQQYFVDTRGNDRPDRGFTFNPFTFDNGALSITADNTPSQLLEAAGGQPYLSGAISTRSKVPGFRYGYVEMRAKVPSGNGLLSTFFLFQPTGNQYEIDILEYLGREPDGATQNYHYRDGFRFADNGFGGVPHASPTMFLETGEDLSQDFHTYSVLWEPGLIVYYIDEREVRRLSGPRVSDVAMDIVLQLVVGTPAFAGDPTQTPFPVSYEIDYIRVHQKP